MKLRSILRWLPWMCAAISTPWAFPSGHAATPARSTTQAASPAAVSATINGTVTDGTGALIPGAVVHLSLQGSRSFRLQQVTGRTGAFALAVPPGRYTVTVEAPGFAVYTRRSFAVSEGGSRTITVRLLVADRHEEISVLADAQASGTDDFASSTVFQGDALKLLSDDPTLLRQQLLALADGFGNPQFVINGFSGDGRLPPKASIRSIHINRNAFSAAYDSRLARVEIDTNAGSDKLHGGLSFSGTDQPLDAFNPYSQVHPPFYDFQQDANLSGPLGKKSSFSLVEQSEHLANSAVINAADPQAPTVLLSTSLAAPQQSETVALRLDRQFSATSFAFIRDEWSHTHTRNDGVQPLLLPEAAYTTDTLTNSLQLAATQMLGAHAVNDIRFQYIRTRLSQNPNSHLPSILVEGSLQTGGSPLQDIRDAQDSYEFGERFELEHGQHTLRAGLRFRSLRDSNSATSGFNGQYIFPDITAYLNRQPTQYSQTKGQPAAVLLTNDLAVYFEDEWRPTRNLFLLAGLRFESQTAVPDHTDPSPRLSIGYEVRPGNRKTSILSLRGGYGIFYRRFPALQLLQSVRQNGTRQVAYIASNPDFNPDGAPLSAVLSAGQPTLYQVDPALRSSYEQTASFRVGRSLGRLGSLSGTFLYEHESHEYLTRNSNAPLTNSSGGVVFPLGSPANIYQFTGRGNGNLESFLLNYNVNLRRGLSAYGLFKIDKSYVDSDAADHFTANPYNIGLDYGRSSLDRTLDYTGGLQATLPWGVQLQPFLEARSGLPFDITTGTDLNGDTIYNDRPTFATDQTRSSVVRTAFGDFDLSPAAGQRRVPRNYGTSPGLIWLELRVSRDFHLGPRPATAISSTGQSGPVPDRPWDLSVGVEVQNVLNHNNPGLPVGQLGASPCTEASCGCTSSVSACPLVPSPYFGHSLTLANDFSPNTASNRTILLHTSLTF